MSTKTSDKASSIVRMTMADMAERADAHGDAIRLENADTNLTPPPHVIQATADAVGVDRHNSYLPLHGLPELREAISMRYSEDFGLDYDPEGEIVVTSGAGEAMLDALLTFVTHGDRVLLTNPTYNGMAQRVRLAGGDQVFTDLVESGGWRLDTDSLREAGEGCSLIFFNSPCMPTGTVFTEDETRAICNLAEELDAPIIFNGSVDKVVFDGRSVTHPASIDGIRDRTLIIGSMSKNYNMPGWRIGWVAGPRELLKRVHDVHIFNGIMPSGITQAGGAAALSGPQDWVKESVATYEANRDAIVAELNTLPGFATVTPEGGYYLISNISGLGVDSRDFCQRLLEEKAVAITPMVAWGRDEFGHDHVRFIITNEPEERLVEAVVRIREFLEES